MTQEESIVFAKKYLEDILTFFGANLAVHASHEDDVIELSVPSSELNAVLIGRGAETLKSLQLLVATALRSKDAAITRVNVDVAGYKRQRAEQLADKAESWIAHVRDSGQPHTVSLNAADRRIVHRVASDYSDITTQSEGEGRDRKIVIAKLEPTE